MRISQIVEGPNDPNIFKAVIMTGSPGSGKSTVAKKLFGNTGLKMLDVDRFWHHFHDKGKEQDFDRNYELVNKQKQNYIDGRLGLIVDGTGRDVDSLIKSKNELESIGYDTILVFVNTDLDTALKRISSRAKETGRNVDKDYTVNAWNQIQKNLGRLQNEFNNMIIVDNSDGAEYSGAEKKVRQWLTQNPRNPKAVQWIDAQQKQRDKS